MNTQDLADVLHSEGLTETNKAAQEIVAMIFDTIREEVASGGTCKVNNFGMFKTVTRAARLGRNPQTGGKVKIPERVVPKFTASKVFKEDTIKFSKKKKR